MFLSPHDDYYLLAMLLSVALLLFIGLGLAALVDKRWRRRHHPMANPWSSYPICLAAVFGTVAGVVGAFLLAWPLSQFMAAHERMVIVACWAFAAVGAVAVLMFVAAMMATAER